MKAERLTESVTLYEGNALDCLPLVEVGSVDSVIADPPYGIVNKFGSRQDSNGGTRTLQFEWDRPDVIRSAIRGSLRLCKRSASAFIFAGFDTCELAREELRSAGFTVKPAAWVKPYPPPAGKGNWWPSAFEIAMYTYRNSPPFFDDDPRRRNVFVCDTYRYGQPGKVDHPTQKPLALIRRIVRAIVPPGGLIIDPTAGSGTTLLAAQLEGRRAIGCEIDPAYCEIIRRRVCEADGAGESSLFREVVQREFEFS